jgi:oligopeptide transport system substrate-binding protein
VELDPVDSKTFQAKFKEGATHIAFVGWGADFPDAQNYLEPNLKTGAGNNKSAYSNPQFDALLDKVGGEYNREKALDTYKEAQKLAHADSPDIFLFYAQANNLRKPWVKNLVDTGMDHQVLGDRNFDKIQIGKH